MQRKNTNSVAVRYAASVRVLTQVREAWLTGPRDLAEVIAEAQQQLPPSKDIHSTMANSCMTDVRDEMTLAVIDLPSVR